MSDANTVLITGTSSGLGRATAQLLATQGYTIIGIARRETSAQDLGLSDGAYAHYCYDLGDIDGIGDLVKAITADHGVPFSLVNNAAIGADGIHPTMHNRDIEAAIRVNLTSPLVLTKYVSRRMAGKGRGRIINISSVVARTGYRGLATYAATKAGLEGFTRSLARELGPRGITVNCIAPGFADTAMTASLGEDQQASIRRRAALGRFPEVDEVAGAVAYLLSPLAAGVTGTTLVVDAGNTA